MSHDVNWSNHRCIRVRSTVTQQSSLSLTHFHFTSQTKHQYPCVSLSPVSLLTFFPQLQLLSQATGKDYTKDLQNTGQDTTHQIIAIAPSLTAIHRLSFQMSLFRLAIICKKTQITRHYLLITNTK